MFLIALPSELHAELLWAASRPSSGWRHAEECARELDPLDDSTYGSYWQVLTSTETKFVDKYRQLAAGQVYQINQNPDIMATFSEHAKMFTLIKNAGVLWQLALYRSC